MVSYDGPIAERETDIPFTSAAIMCQAYNERWGDADDRAIIVVLNALLLLPRGFLPDTIALLRFEEGYLARGGADTSILEFFSHVLKWHTPEDVANAEDAAVEYDPAVARRSPCGCGSRNMTCPAAA